MHLGLGALAGGAFTAAAIWAYWFFNPGYCKGCGRTWHHCDCCKWCGVKRYGCRRCDDKAQYESDDEAEEEEEEEEEEDTL